LNDACCLHVVKHVSNERDGRLAQQIDLCGHVDGPLGVDVGDGNDAACRSELSCCAQTDALSTTDDQRRLSFKLE